MYFHPVPGVIIPREVPVHTFKKKAPFIVRYEEGKGEQTRVVLRCRLTGPGRLHLLRIVSREPWGGRKSLIYYSARPGQKHPGSSHVLPEELWFTARQCNVCSFLTSPTNNNPLHRRLPRYRKRNKTKDGRKRNWILFKFSTLNLGKIIEWLRTRMSFTPTSIQIENKINTIENT